MKRYNLSEVYFSNVVEKYILLNEQDEERDEIKHKEDAKKLFDKIKKVISFAEKNVLNIRKAYSGEINITNINKFLGKCTADFAKIRQGLDTLFYKGEGSNFVISSGDQEEKISLDLLVKSFIKILNRIEIVLSAVTDFSKQIYDNFSEFFEDEKNKKFEEIPLSQLEEKIKTETQVGSKEGEGEEKNNISVKPDKFTQIFKNTVLKEKNIQKQQTIKKWQQLIKFSGMQNLDLQPSASDKGFSSLLFGDNELKSLTAELFRLPFSKFNSIVNDENYNGKIIFQNLQNNISNQMTVIEKEEKKLRDYESSKQTPEEKEKFRQQLKKEYNDKLKEIKDSEVEKTIRGFMKIPDYDGLIRFFVQKTDVKFKKEHGKEIQEVEKVLVQWKKQFGDESIESDVKKENKNIENFNVISERWLKLSNLIK